MTKWGFALPCNVVADGWVEPAQKTNLANLIFSRPRSASSGQALRTGPSASFTQDYVLGYSQSSLRDSIWRGQFSRSP